MNVFKTENISHSFNGKKVLDNVSLQIGEGEFFAIAGPNGSGKTTLLKILNGILAPSSGEVFLFEKSVSKYRLKEKSKILGILPAEIEAFEDFTVKDVVLMGRSPHLKWWKDYTPFDEDIADTILAELKIEHLALRAVGSLSSGEKQKVFIAQALCQFPKVLLLDEPTSHLDIHHQIEIFLLLDALCKEKKLTIIVVSHDINLLSRYCQKLLLLKEGSIAACGDPRQVITCENILNVYGAVSSIAQVTPDGRPHVYITGIKK